MVLALGLLNHLFTVLLGPVSMPSWMTKLTLRHTTIESHHLSPHPATCLSAQEMDNIGNHLRSANTVCRAEASDHFEHLLVLALKEEFSAGRAWGDSVHANALTHEVFGHDADHLLDGTFGGVVEEIGRHDSGGLGEGGGNQNDV